MNEEYRKLYDAVSAKFDIGGYDEFLLKMQTEEQRKKFYDIVSSKGFTLGDYNQYEGRLKKKEKPTASTQQQEPTSTPIGDTTPQEQPASQQDMQQPAFDRQSAVGQGINVLQQARQEMAQQEIEQSGIVPYSEQPQTVSFQQPTRDERLQEISQDVRGLEEEKKRNANYYLLLNQDLQDEQKRIETQRAAYEEYAQARNIPAIVNLPENAYTQEKINKLNEFASKALGKDVFVFNSDGTPTEQKQAVDEYIGFVSYIDDRNKQDDIIKQSRKEAEDVSMFKRTKAYTSQLYQGLRGITDPILLFSERALADAGFIDLETYYSEKEGIEFEAAVTSYRNKLLMGINPENVDKSSTELLANGEIVDGLASLMTEGIAQIPQLALMAVTGGSYGMATLGTSSAMRHYVDVADRPDLTLSEKIGQSVVLGAAEYFSERIFNADVRALRGEATSKGLMGLIKQGAEEGFEEFSVAMIEQAINYVNNNEFNVYAVADATALGFGMGSGIGVARAVATKGASALGSYLTAKKRKELEQRYTELNNELKNNRNLSVNDKINIRAALRENINEYNNLIKSDAAFYETMSIEDITNIVSLNQRINQKLLDAKKSNSDVVRKQILNEAARLVNEKQAIEQKYANQQVTNQQVTSEVQQVVEQFEDDQTVTTTVRSLEEIPEPFRDRAREISKGTKVRKSFLGIPYGKETDAPKAYSYTATGKELKDYFNANKATFPAQETTTQQAEKQQVEGEDLSQKSATIVTEKLDAASKKVANNQPINEVELQDAINEAYSALDQIEKDKTISQEDKEILTELYEDEIQNLESYDNITTTETRKIAEEKTVRTVKKTPRKTTPTREKDFVGKKAVFSDNKGGGGTGTISIVETPDGREYYVLETPSRPIYEIVGAKSKGETTTRKVKKVDELGKTFVLGETSTAFKNATVNRDAEGNPTSVTFKNKSGTQVTVKDANIARDVELEQMKQEEYDEQVFEETYIEFVDEEKVEVKKSKINDTQAKQQVPSGKQEGKATEQAKPKQEPSGKEAEAGGDVQAPTEKEVEDVAKKTGITPKNLRDLYKINRDMFGLNKVKAFANAVVMDINIGQIASRTVLYNENGKEKIAPFYANSTNGKVFVNVGTSQNPIKKEVTAIKVGLTKQEMYGKLEFRKGNKDTFKQLSARGKALFQIVGENAQLSQIIRDNLGVAVNMEKSGKDAKIIRLATGWERGKDGKWRYEVQDIGFNEDAFEALEESKEYSITDVVPENDPIFTLYPQLKNIKITKKGGRLDFFDQLQGYFDPERNIINITPYAQDKRSTFIHEVQHAIQEIEDFAKGGNMSSVILSLPTSKINEYADKAIKQIKSEIEEASKSVLSLRSLLKRIKEDSNFEMEFNSLVYNLREKGKNQADEYKRLKNEGVVNPYSEESLNKIADEKRKAIKELEDFLTKNGFDKKMGDYDAGVRLMYHRFGKEDNLNENPIEKIEASIEDSNKKIKKLNDEYVKIESANNKKELAEAISDRVPRDDAFKYYESLAGEVEARNVQARMGMTEEQRRQTTLQETEKIARDEQIVLFGEGNVPQGVKMQVDAWHGSPYQFDKFTTEKIGTGEGAQAFGWGLYFTDLEGIARDYAVKLTDITKKQIINNPTKTKSFLNFVGDFFNNVNPYEKFMVKTPDKYNELLNSGHTKQDVSNGMENYIDFKNKEDFRLNSIRNIFEKYSTDEDATKEIIVKELKSEISEANNEILRHTENWKGRKAANRIIAENTLVLQFLETKSNEDVSNVFKEFRDELNLTLDEKRKLYKVTLHKGKTPDQYTWLEWDKPVGRDVVKKLIDHLSSISDTFKQYYADTYLKEIEDGNYDNISGRDFYNGIAKSALQKIGKRSPKDVSLALLESGVDGIKYPAESVSRGATSDNARGFNYVVFDENAVSIEEVIKFQKDAVKARGAMMMAMDGRAIIYALEDPNVSTPLHELAHVFEHYLTEAERNSVLKWANSKEWTTEVSEKFARGWERFLADGKAPTANLQKIFNKFKEWLTDIYNGITNSEIDIKLNKPMQDIYSRMLGEETQAPTEKEIEDVAALFESNPELANSVYEALGFNPIQSIINNSENTLDLSNKLKSLTKNDFLKNSFEKLIPYIEKNSNIEFTALRTIGVGEALYTGEFTVLPNEHRDLQDFIKTYIHELYHVITLNELSNNKKFNLSITKLREESIEKLGLDKEKFKNLKNTDFGLSASSLYYGLLNNQEFISELFSNKQFSDKLDTIKIEKNKSLLDKGFDLINRLFNKTSTSDKLRNFILNNIKEKILFDRSDVNMEVSKNMQEAAKSSDYVFTPNTQQKQQAQELYSEYLKTTNNPTIDGFKKWNENKGVSGFSKAFEKGADNALAWLEQQEKELDKFGKETLGINLPVAVAKVAIQAAKVAIKTSKTAVEVLKAAKDAVKATDWYKNLSSSKRVSAMSAVEALFGFNQKNTSKTYQRLQRQKAKEIKKAYKSIDKDMLTDKYKKRLEDDMARVENGDVSNTQWIINEARNQQALKDVNSYKSKFKTAIKRIGFTPEAIGNIQSMFAKMAIDNAFATIMYSSSGVNRLFGGKAKADIARSDKEKIMKRTIKTISPLVKDRARRSFIATLIQAETREEFDDLWNDIQISVKTLKEKGNEEQRADAIEIEKALKQIETNLDKIYEQSRSGDIKDLVGAVSTEDIAMIKFWVETFEEQSDRYQMHVEQVRGKKFKPVGRFYTYRKRTPLNKSYEIIDPFSDEFMGFSEIFEDEAQTKGFKSRVKADPTRSPLSYNFELDMMNEWHKREMDINMGEHILQFKDLLKNDKFKEFFGYNNDIQKSNRDQLKNWFKNYLNKENVDTHMTKTEKIALRAASEISNWGTKFALGQISQLIKQSTVVLRTISNLVFSGKNPLYAITDVGSALWGQIGQRKGMKSLINQYPIGRRSYSKYGMLELYQNLPPSERRKFVQTMKQSYSWFRNVTDKTMLTFLELSDRKAAEFSWAAFYADYISKNEKRLVTDWAKEAEKPNDKAAAYAELMIGQTQQASEVEQTGVYVGGATERSKLKSGFSAARMILFPFLGFNLNRMNAMTTNFQKLVSAKNTLRAKGEAVGDIVGVGAEAVGFGFARLTQYKLIGGAAGLIISAFGGEPPEEDDDEKEIKRKAEKFALNASGIASIIPFYGVTLDAEANNLMNKVFFYNYLTREEQEKFYNKGVLDDIEETNNYLLENPNATNEELLKLGYLTPIMIEAQEKQALQRFNRSSTAPFTDYSNLEDGMGKFGIPFKKVKETYGTFEEYMNYQSYQYINSYGSVSTKEYSEEEKQLLGVAALLQATQIILPQEPAAIGRKIKSQVRKAESKDSKADAEFLINQLDKLISQEDILSKKDYDDKMSDLKTRITKAVGKEEQLEILFKKDVINAKEYRSGLKTYRTQQKNKEKEAQEE